MRESKFQVFFYDGSDYKTGEMLTAQTAFCENYIEFNQFGSLVPTDECSIIRQFTGLKDANGTDIYEGDILSDSNSRFTVEYDAPSYEMKRLDGAYQYPYFRSRASGFEVIGNIYENSELVELPATQVTGS